MLHRPANWFRSRSQQISSPLVPSSTAFSFFRFHPKLYGPLPKSQLPLTTRFCPTPPTVEATHRFPHSAVHSILAQHQLPKFSQEFPPTTSFNKFISSHPARENFCTRQLLRFADAQLTETTELPSFAHPSSQFEVVAHSKRLSTRQNWPQTVCPAITQSQMSTNQHMKRFTQVFQTTSASARNHL